MDGSPARFNATSDRPSINNPGDIAFLDEIQGTFRQDIFRGQEESFTTIFGIQPTVGCHDPAPQQQRNRGLADVVRR